MSNGKVCSTEGTLIPSAIVMGFFMVYEHLIKSDITYLMS